MLRVPNHRLYHLNWQNHLKYQKDVNHKMRSKQTIRYASHHRNQFKKQNTQKRTVSHQNHANNNLPADHNHCDPHQNHVNHNLLKGHFSHCHPNHVNNSLPKEHNHCDPHPNHFKQNLPKDHNNHLSHCHQNHGNNNLPKTHNTCPQTMIHTHRLLSIGLDSLAIFVHSFYPRHIVRMRIADMPTLCHPLMSFDIN